MKPLGIQGPRPLELAGSTIINIVGMSNGTFFKCFYCLVQIFCYHPDQAQTEGFCVRNNQQRKIGAKF